MNEKSWEYSWDYMIEYLTNLGDIRHPVVAMERANFNASECGKIAIPRTHTMKVK